MLRRRHPPRPLSLAILIATALAILAGGVLRPAVAAELFLVDEREFYLALDKLNAMGALPGFLANTRPYDMKAVRDALDNNSLTAQSPVFESGLAQWLALYAKNRAVVRGTASLSWSDRGTDRENNDGVTTPDGFSGGLSALGRWEPLPYLSGHAKGTAWFGRGGEDNTFLGDTALEFGHEYLSLQAGVLSTWYGPGRRGGLIFTNNAEPYVGVRLHNPVPIPMPWIFSFLGNFQYDLFLAKLGDDRPIPDSRLFGMRLAFRPSAFLEFGVSRAIHYGGQGQDNGFGAWWDAFRMSDINQYPGTKENELAGLDVEVTLPFRVQPVQLYFEIGGEDQHPSTVPYPTKYAYLGGIFLPAILGNPSIDLRFEYADNHSDGDGPIWYVHPDYPHSHENRILGHPMGTDAQDWFVEAHWFFLPSTYLALNWTSTARYHGSRGSGDMLYIPGAAKEEINRLGASFVGWFTKSIRMEALVEALRVTNQDGTPGKDSSDYTLGVAFSWQFSGG
jgi:hypothetical protein